MLRHSHFSSVQILVLLHSTFTLHVIERIPFLILRNFHNFYKLDSVF